VSPRLRLLVLAVGAAIFAYLVSRIGLHQIAEDFRRAGWAVVPVVLLWVPIYLCWAGAWHLTMADAPERPTYWRTFAITLSSFAVNAVTPLAQVGGEPFRAGVVSQWLGAQRATGSVVTYYMLHALSNIVLWLAGIGVAFAAFTPPAALVAPLLLTAAAMMALIAWLFAAHRGGVVAPLVRLLGRIPGLGRLARRLDSRAAWIEEVDRLITGFYHGNPRRFVLALTIDFAGRALMMVEYWLIAHGIGLDVSMLQAFLIGTFVTLSVNILFFFPMEVGVKEGSMYALFHVVGLDPSLGVFAAIFQRLRELSWVAVGLGLVWHTARRDRPAGSTSSSLP
jgi:uncharacterized protein (TIRG00374 family)